MPTYGFKSEDIVNSNRITQEEIDEIKEWALTQKVPRLNDEQVVNFVLSCERNIDLAKNTVIEFYKTRKDYKELFNNRNLQGDHQTCDPPILKKFGVRMLTTDDVQESEFLYNLLSPKFDSWGGQTNPSLYDDIFKDDNHHSICTLKVIPARCTPLCQPCDVYFYRQVKNFIKRLQNCSALIEKKREISGREDCIKIHSLVHHQLSASVFNNMLRYAWFASKLTDDREVFLYVNEVCFNSNVLKKPCSCKNPTLLRCAVCYENLCFQCFYDIYHPNNCLPATLIEYIYLPKRTKTGEALIYHKLSDTTYWKYKMSPSMKLLFMTIDAAVYQSPPTGLIILFDMKGVSLMHLTRIKVGIIKAFSQYTQDALPAKLIAIHVLNTQYFINKIMAFFKPFLKPHIYNLLHFHPPTLNLEDFHKNFVDKDCLPADLGGTLKPTAELHQDNIKLLRDMKQFFDEEENERNEFFDTE